MCIPVLLCVCLTSANCMARISPSPVCCEHVDLCMGAAIVLLFPPAMQDEALEISALTSWKVHTSNESLLAVPIDFYMGAMAAFLSPTAMQGEALMMSALTDIWESAQ